MIRNMLLSEVSAELGALDQCPDLEISGVAIDSRKVSEGDLFIALRGERFDGHDFLDQAVENGCSAMVLEEKHEALCPVIKVDDTQIALAQIAGLNRREFTGKVVGITGSTGKTSVKNMLAGILALSAGTHATEGNFNNEIGVPLTLLGIDKNHRYAVVEMGARKIGDIDYLGRFVRPDVATVLNVGCAHIEIFGSYENILSAKSEIYDSIPQDGVGVVNLDDAGADGWLNQLNGKSVLTYSLESSGADISASDIECKDDSTQFILNYEDGASPVNLRLVGRHNVANALAAAACAKALGISVDQIVEGLESVISSQGRLQFIPLGNGTRVIDDSYNANPVSMKSAIDVLALQSGKKIAVLGEMAELGELADTMHLEVARHASEKDIDTYYLIGTYASAMAEVLGEKARCFDSNEDLAAALGQELSGNEVVLVKGSRSAGMDNVIDCLKGALH